MFLCWWLLIEIDFGFWIILFLKVLIRENIRFDKNLVYPLNIILFWQKLKVHYLGDKTSKKLYEIKLSSWFNKFYLLPIESLQLYLISYNHILFIFRKHIQYCYFVFEQTYQLSLYSSALGQHNDIILTTCSVVFMLFCRLWAGEFQMIRRYLNFLINNCHFLWSFPCTFDDIDFAL